MRIFISHSSEDAADAAELRRVLTELGREVALASNSEAPGEVTARIRSSDIVIAYLSHPSPNTLVELGIAIGAGRATVLVGSVGEPSIADASYLPSITPSGNAIRDAHAVLATIERVANTLPEPSSSPVTLSSLAADPAALDAVDGRTFERLVMNWFVSVGAQIERAERDQGYDFRLVHDGQVILVEVKKLSRQSRVPVEALRSLSQAAHLSGSAGAVLVTSAPLTSAAESMALDNSIAVISVPDLVASSSIGEVIGAAANKELQLTTLTRRS